MELDEIIQSILKRNRDLTKDAVIRMIEKKIEEANGYLSMEGAARIIASDLGIKIEYEKRREEVPISHLIAGVNDVSIFGMVLDIYPPKSFKRRDGSEGKILKLKIGDGSGEVPVIFWNEKADLILNEKLKIGDVIKVMHGYVKPGLYSKLEVHVGTKGKIKVLDKKN